MLQQNAENKKVPIANSLFLYNVLPHETDRQYVTVFHKTVHGYHVPLTALCLEKFFDSHETDNQLSS
jgi:hypothetical protein